MIFTNLYNMIYEALANDADVLNYLGIEDAGDILVKSQRIQRRARPKDVVDKAFPVITFYACEGESTESNFLGYRVSMAFDIYTQNDVDTAHLLAQRITHLFIGAEDSEAGFESGYETVTDSTNTYCFTVKMVFLTTLE